MPKRLPSKLRRMIFNYDWEIVEIQGSIFKIVWGFWLLLPFNTFLGQPVYDALASLTNEVGWGLFVFILGLCHLLTIAYGTVKWRRAFILVACMFWMFLSVIFGITRTGSALIPLTIVITFFLAINYLRLGLPNVPSFLKRRLGYEV